MFAWQTPCIAAVLAGLLTAQDPPQPPPHSLAALLDGTGFVQIKPGEFYMGTDDGNSDEEPRHLVRITRGFELGKFEVSQAQWDAVMRSPHMRTKPGADKDVNPSHFKGQNLPVESVSWNAVQQFIERLNQRDPTHLYRLPTEAEWEFAARAGAENESLSDLDAKAWYEANSGGATHPVGKKAPNAWGLHDMAGNVLEWVSDWHGFDYYATSPGVDPGGPSTGSYKVYRGCGWHSAPSYCRASFRSFDFPIAAQAFIGFRLARERKE